MHRSPLVHVIALLPFLLPHVSGTAPVTLVEDGKSAYTIYVAPDAVGSVSRAAQELRRVIQVSTGVALPIGHTPTEAMICLGDNAAARGAGIKVTDMLPESFRFLTRGDSVFIAGPDTPPPPTIHDPASRGTLTGVYAFLEKIVGARWLMPGEIGEDIPAQERLDVPDLDEQHSPTFRIRALSYVQEREHASVREWLVRNRVGRSRFLAVSHSWDDHPPRDLVMKHPEWWPKQGGERRRPEDAHKSVQKYCTTNQDYVHAFAASMAKRLDGWGTAGYQRNMASASPSDGSGWCECSACKQGWEATDDHPLTGPKLYRHSLTPTILTFYNGIREALNTHHPDAWVGGFVYAAYTYPPREPIQLADRIFLMMAPRVNYGLTMYRPEYRDEFEPFLASWRAVTPHLGYYAVDTWMRSVLGTPLPASRPILRPMYPLLRKHGVSAVLHYGLAAWGYGAPHNYLVARLMWDADADIDAVYEEFFRRAYGKGDAPMMAIYDLLERELGRFEQQEKGFNYDMTSEIVMAVYQPNYWTIEALYRKAMAAAETDRQRQRLEVFADNLRVLHATLVEAGLLKQPARSAFHIPADEYPAFHKRISSTCYVAPRPKRDVGFITRLFIPQHRQLTVPRLPAAIPEPVLDGHADDPAWTESVESRDLRPVGNNQPAALPTEFRVLYTDDALFVAFTCHETSPETIITAGNGRDDASIYTGDTFELFVGNVENRRKHWHLTMSPANLQWDAWDGDPAGNTLWQSATTRTETGWKGEIRIPFTIFGLDAPPTGKRWHVNVGREDKPTRENSTWSNVENHFLETQNFGTWTFGE